MEKKKTQKNTIITKIAVSTFIAIFSLASAFAGTYAWFSSNQAVTVSGGSFKVQVPEGLDFVLYYLDGFDTNSDGVADKTGNYSTSIGEYIGYEKVPNGGTAIFELADLEDPDDNPTDISHLWPNHRLTYALVVSGDFASFTLESFVETRGITAKVLQDPDDESSSVTSESTVSLTWATNIYSAAYHVGSNSNDILADISTGFHTYFVNDSTDKFNYDQVDIPTPAPWVAKEMAHGGNSITGSGDRVILYLSIAFDNASNTYYKLSNDESYYIKDTSGNSNCYMKLKLDDIVFKIA